MSIKKVFKKFIPDIFLARFRALTTKKLIKGSRSYIAPNVQFIGAANVRIGNNTCIGERTWFNVNERIGDVVGISIGDNCFIGRDNFFSSGLGIEIGSYTLTTVNCKFISSSHRINDPSLPYIAAGTTATDFIRVGVNCFFGAGSMVIGNISIGHGSVIAAGAQVTKDVPPFSIVVGAPGKIAKRYCFFKRVWISTSLIDDETILGHPDENLYLDHLKNTYPSLAMPLIAATSKLGNL